MDQAPTWVVAPAFPTGLAPGLKSLPLTTLNFGVSIQPSWRAADRTAPRSRSTSRTTAEPRFVHPIPERAFALSQRCRGDRDKRRPSSFASTSHRRLLPACCHPATEGTSYAVPSRSTAHRASFLRPQCSSDCRRPPDGSRLSSLEQTAPHHWPAVRGRSIRRHHRLAVKI